MGEEGEEDEEGEEGGYEDAEEGGECWVHFFFFVYQRERFDDER